MNNKDNEAKRIRSLINSHLYDLEGIKNCTIFVDFIGKISVMEKITGRLGI